MCQAYADMDGVDGLFGVDSALREWKSKVFYALMNVMTVWLSTNVIIIVFFSRNLILENKNKKLNGNVGVICNALMECAMKALYATKYANQLGYPFNKMCALCAVVISN